MTGLTWFQARALAKAGKAIRRADWRKWLVREKALSFISRIADDGTKLYYVVPASEFGAAEFMANDWTDEPWDTTLPTPAGYDSTGTGSTPAAGGDTSGAPLTGGVGAGHFGDEGNPPDPQSTYQPSGGGGGVGAGSTDPDDTKNKKETKKPDAQPPVVTVTIVQPFGFGGDYNAANNCIVGGSEDPRSLPEIAVHVSVAGGPAGIGTISVVLQGTTQLGTAWPGMSRDYSFTGISWVPGATITATATYSINGTEVSGSGTYGFPDWCGWIRPTAILYGPGFSAFAGINGHTVDSDIHSGTIQGGGAGPYTFSCAPGGIIFLADVINNATAPEPFPITITYDYPEHPLSATFPLF